MATRDVRFVGFKVVKKPTKVTFKTKTGKTVSFKAFKTLKKPKVVRFRAKR